MVLVGMLTMAVEDGARVYSHYDATRCHEHYFSMLQQTRYEYYEMRVVERSAPADHHEVDNLTWRWRG